LTAISFNFFKISCWLAIDLNKPPPMSQEAPIRNLIVAARALGTTKEDMAMLGTFSYEKDDRMVFYHLTFPIKGESYCFGLIRIDPFIAALRFYELSTLSVGDPITTAAIVGKTAPPKEFSMWAATLEGEEQVPVRNEEFIVTWVGNYVMKFGGRTIFALDNQKQQCARSLNGANIKTIH
jgi:hypothetical protein